MNAESQKPAAATPLNKLNLIASLAFFFGSSLFLPQFSNYATIGVYLFMLGSALMFIDTVRAKLFP